MLSNIKSLYDSYCLIQSDINEHLPVLKKYGKKVSHITEMGVRTGVSTVAFLEANPKILISYDIDDSVFVIKDTLLKESKINNIDFRFILGDTLSIEIEPTELLFIDTLHVYNQLRLELDRHSKKVSKYLIFHDTTTFGTINECMYDNSSPIVKNMPKDKCGIFNAILDFLQENDGLNWELYERFDNNNGLTVLKRK